MNSTSAINHPASAGRSWISGRGPVLLVLSAICVLIAGCGHRSPSLDSNLARSSLERAMEQWKSGGDQTGLNTGSEPIVMNDVDWRSGAQLVSYKILDQGEDMGANLHATLELVVKEKQKKPRKQKITYIVGTSPVVTIFRN